MSRSDGLGQWDRDGLSSWNNIWVGQFGRIGHSQLEGGGRASDIVMLGPVGKLVELVVQSGGKGQCMGPLIRMI